MNQSTNQLTIAAFRGLPINLILSKELLLNPIMAKVGYGIDWHQEGGDWWGQVTG